jgi:hypothetical protein
MRTFDSASVAATAFAAGAALLVLTGCAQITNALEQRHEEHFETYAEAVDGWVGVDIPDWIPDDATDLRNLATNDETVAVIRVATGSPLAGQCELEERVGLPALAPDWSVEKWPDEIARCGSYEVMPMDDGWLGWFQATEAGQRPD